MPTQQSHTYRIRTMPPSDQKCGKSVILANAEQTAVKAAAGNNVLPKAG